VVKPHPRNSAGAVARITAALTADGSAPVLRLGYGGVPVELAAIPFALSASAALASSASCSLQRLYGTIGYCAPDLVERFVEPTRRRVVEAWLKDNQAVLRTL
jgi:hypothetical protein